MERSMHEDIRIEPYRDEHLDELVPMWRESFEHGVGIRDPHPIEEQRRHFLAEVLPRNDVRVALLGQKIVGFVAASSTSIAQLYVRMGFQRRGVGSRLLAWAKERSAGSLWLYTFERNGGARAFYERHGFRIAARGYEAHWKLEDLRYEWRVQDGLFAAGAYRCVELATADLPRLQRFFEENPQYFRRVNGCEVRPDEAQREYAALPPADWPYRKRWILGFEGDEAALAAIADVTSDLPAPGAWHIGLFIVATSLHGSGNAQAIYRGLEAWMLTGGARWARLGVAVGNAAAERFWERTGYVEVRRRLGVTTAGDTKRDMRVMVKLLAGGTLADYLAQVPRDRPEAP